LHCSIEPYDEPTKKVKTASGLARKMKPASPRVRRKYVEIESGSEEGGSLFVDD